MIRQPAITNEAPFGFLLYEVLLAAGIEGRVEFLLSHFGLDLIIQVYFSSVTILPITES